MIASDIVPSYNKAPCWNETFERKVSSRYRADNIKKLPTV